MKIAMIGAGYVGLVSGACMADFGHNVTCVDSDRGKIDALLHGEVPIYEPGLAPLISRNTAAGRLHFTSDLNEALLQEPEAVFIAVGTPARRGDGHADLSYVFRAAEEIARGVAGSTVIVTKSTVPVGTGAEVRRLVQAVRPDLLTAANPEFLREGSAIEDFKRPDRIVIGADDERAREVLRAVYRPLFLNETPLLMTGIASAEMIKYAANAFLAMKITFINEIADLCERTGADVREVARGIGADRRIGSKFLHPGPGYGGSCFPKDTEALVRTARDCNTPLHLVETTVAVNDARKKKTADKIIKALPVQGKAAVWGLTFKPNTDDMREAPSLSILPLLQKAGITLQVHDPVAAAQAAHLLPGVTLCDDPYAAAEGADALILMTEWDCYRAPDLPRLRRLLRGDLLIDLRNVYRRAEIEAAGFRYIGTGT